MDVFILSGQSNMAGRGGVHSSVWDEVVPLECTPPVDCSILRLSAGLQWEAAQEPLHFDIDTKKTCGLGPGLVFAAKCAVAGATIGLVPCAVGGTAMAEWHHTSELYTNMIQRARSAVAQAGAGARIRALLWYQGESDTLSLDDASCFSSRLRELIANVRRDLLLPDLLVIQVGITIDSHPYPHLLEQVREAQRQIDIPDVYYVDAQGLPLQEDNVHLTTEGQVVLGSKLAALYKQTVKAAH